MDVNDDGSECDGGPSAADDTAVTGENTAVRVDVQANDRFGAVGAGALELVSTSIAGSVTLDDNGSAEDASDDAFVYTPETDFSGTGSFVYRIVNDAGESAEATVAVEVTASLRIAIDFPASGAALGGAERFSVRGRLTDLGDGVVSADEVTAVEVNGVAAVLDDADPSVWRVEVPLEPRLSQGLEATVVSTTGRRSVSQGVNNAPILIEPGALALSADASTAYVIDVFGFRRALLSVNLRTEEWTVVSGEGPGLGSPFGSPVSLALSTDETTAYIVDSDGSPALLSVNLATGERTVVSDNGTGGEPMFVDPASVVVSADETTAYVADSGLNAIVSVELATGDRTVVSDAAMGGDPQFMRPRSLVLSADETIAYVVDAGLAALLSVNLVTGDRTVLADNDTPDGGRRFNNPGVVAVNVDETTAYVVSSRDLLSVDLATGVRTQVSRFRLSPAAVALSADETTAYVSGAEIGILAIDLVSGEETSVSNGARGGGPQLSSPQLLALSAEGTTAYVLDPVFDAPLLSVDLASGDRSVISDGETASGPEFQAPRSMALSVDETTMFVVDSTVDALISVNLATGDRTVVSDDDTGGEPQFDDPQSIALSADDTTAYVVDLGLAALLSVNLATGDRTVVSDAAIGGEPEFFRPRAIALNASETIAYVGDGDSLGIGSLLAVNLTTGARTVIFQGGNGGSPSPNPPQSIELSADETTAYVAEAIFGFPEVFSVNLASGALMSVSDEDRGLGPQLFSTRSMALSPDETTAYVLDSTYNALISVDLATGSRAIISR